MSNSTGTNLENRISNENLVRRIQNGEETAANMAQLWQQTKAFIAMIARKYTGYAEFDDLVQEGYLGLYEAVNHYDIVRGIPFINYASYWITQRIRRYIECNSTIRVSFEMYQLTVKYRRIVEEYTKEYGREPSEREIKKHLGVSDKRLARIKENAKRGQIRSLSEGIDGEGENLTLADTVAADINLEEDSIRKIDRENLSRELWSWIEEHSDNASGIFWLKYQNGLTLEQIGDNLGISKEEVRSIEQKALRRIRKDIVKTKHRKYYEEYLSAASSTHIGVETFNRTWTSEVERVAIYNKY
ncbi:sigma-70 family RNA polymerase sigma factor [Dorea formicigenerans]|uniref:RNA polymerase subunit sigma-70 n=1 Tax=Dorea formicigenerans TaxID=39486 RepID=A0A3E5GQA1_9FIRM|nr:sigma-70 family RNA polymerase sigma factor [Dorea formicigenerans]RGO48269.1 RNA polymerase subunit sigma-70 [Dorea formicigenerans]